jgi:hypothetical protein
VAVIEAKVSVTTNAQGEFIVTNLEPGSYTVSVSYLGFSSQNKDVTVAAGQVAKVDVVLPVATQNEQVVVTAGRSYGEAEAVNEIRAADNVLNILPAAVITSLPNANVADAVGRLPGVTLERDEGEGKYVQIRGTAPNLSNLTMDGIVVPSPEGGVRQVKLDTIPADLIDSVQINKTLQANMDADAIGGSVNLVTKTAWERLAFILPPVDPVTGALLRYGNAGNGLIRSPHVWQVDLALQKETKLTERFGLEFGVQVFNIFNHTELADPHSLSLDYSCDQTVTPVPCTFSKHSNFGIINTLVNTNANSDKFFADNTGTGVARQLQLFARFKF